MSKDSPINANVSITGLAWVAFILLFVTFCGEPDIHDAVIYKLTDGAMAPEGAVIVKSGN